MSSKKIFEEIWSYYDFHKEINKYFDEGINYNPSAKEEEIYFIDSKWIENWKEYSDYEKIIKEKKDYNLLKGINYDKNHIFPRFETGKSASIFLSKTVHQIKDFDCLVNKKTYKSFKKYQTNIFKSLFKNELYKIKIAFYKKLFVLFIEKQNRMILYSKFIQQPHDELIKITFDLPKGFKKEEGKDLVGLIFTKKNMIDYNYEFKEKYLKDTHKRQNLINELTKDIGIGNKAIGVLNIVQKPIKITNNNLLKKQIISMNNVDATIISLKNFNLPRLIGLQNIGATCYMNATLQCLVNIKELTKYLLNKDNFTYIINNIHNCELLGSYCRLLVKLCCDENVKNSYAPNKFKNILSLKNPLFEGIQANDSKDLIYFLFEQFNHELNVINLKINENLKKTKNCDFIDDISQTNKQFMFDNFINEYSPENNNIIPKIFFSLIESETICNGCNTKKYNYQIVFSLELSLEIIYNKIYGNQNMNTGKKKLNLLECIQNYNETNYFTGENSMYCNICQKQQDSIYNKRMHSLSPILVIILNRGKANKFDCEVDFPEQLNFQQHILNPSINVSYKLIGVVTHFGTSDMGGHFIAYCKHRILNEWYCYNDAAVSKLSDPKNGYKNGVPYILFYESDQGNENILFDNMEINNLQNNQNNQIKNFNQNLNNHGFINENDMNNMNFQKNINIITSNINNMNLNNMSMNVPINNNFQNNFNFNQNPSNNMMMNNNINNMNNNINVMPNIMNYNMNMNNIINNNNNIPFNNINNNMNNNMTNNMNNNVNSNIINIMDKFNINNNMNNAMNYKINNINNNMNDGFNNNFNNMNNNINGNINNMNNIQINNPNINSMNIQQMNNLNNN